MSERNLTRKQQTNQQDSKEIPDWLPDWRNYREYPDPDKTSMKQWAWEFLRRNPQYHGCCYVLGVTPKDPALCHPDCADWGLNYFLHPLVSSEELPKEFFCSIPMFHIFDLDEYTCRKDYEKRERDFLDSLGRESEYREKIRFQGPPREIQKPLIPRRPAELVVRFALDYPIDKQIKRLRDKAKEIREQLQIGKSKPRVNRFPEYLRLLDAETCNVGQKRMAEVLYPHFEEDWETVRPAVRESLEKEEYECPERRVSYALQQAHSYRSSRYMELAVLEERK